MVKRGIIEEVPKKTRNGWGYMLFVWKSIHRYRFPSILVFVIIDIIFSKQVLHGFEYSLWGLLYLELFYISVAFHESVHYAMAKYLGYKTESLIIVPYTFGVRTCFSKKKVIPPDDLFCIIFAGPIVPIILCLLLLVIGVIFKFPLAFFMCILIFSFINIVSLLPINGSDGRRTYNYCKSNKDAHKIKLILFGIICFIAAKIRFYDATKYGGGKK